MMSMVGREDAKKEIVTSLQFSYMLVMDINSICRNAVDRYI